MNCDTPRTEEELLAIFADGQGPNTISPQDLRDFIVSVMGAPDYVTLTRLAVPSQSVPDSDYSWRAAMDTVSAQAGTGLAYDLDVGSDHHAEIAILEDGLYQLSVQANLPNLSAGAWAYGASLDPSPAVSPGNLVFQGMAPPPIGEVISPAATFAWWLEAGIQVSAQFVQDSGAPVGLTYAQLSVLRLRR